MSFNNAVCKGVFSDKQNFSDIKPKCKKESKNEKKSYRPAWVLPKWLNSLNMVCTIKLIVTLKKYSQNIYGFWNDTKNWNALTLDRSHMILFMNFVKRFIGC